MDTCRNSKQFLCPNLAFIYIYMIRVIVCIENCHLAYGFCQVILIEEEKEIKHNVSKRML